MTTFSKVLSEAYSCWVESLSSCASSMASSVERHKPTRRGVEKDAFVIHRDQPGFTPPPSLNPLARTTQAEFLVERPPVVSRRGRRSFSVQKRFWPRKASSVARRPHISAPSNFQHISTGSLQFPAPTRSRPRSFRPLELSIYAVNDHLSPILPLFEDEKRCVTPPRPAYTRDSLDSDASTLAHQRSQSTLSFQLPRRPVPQRSLSTINWDDSPPPRIPPRSRLRANTPPERVDRIVERIASAMLEKEILQSEIDSIVERQSIYLGNSRPSTANGVEKIAPMPAIPALPAAAPSFAERLSLDRPRTAPPKAAIGGGPVSKTQDPSPAFNLSQLPRTPSRFTSPSKESVAFDRPMAPPLPLVLRPPLRKKKSFSRVSNWLFPGGAAQDNTRDTSFEFITNAPRPVTDSDGFYTCVASPTGRTSVDTVSSSYSWSNDEDEDDDENRSYGTSLSPAGSPIKPLKQQTPTMMTRSARMGALGQLSINARQHRPQSVGVAY